jgi:O-antigen/teichoic acid export membrane protein
MARLSWQSRLSVLSLCGQAVAYGLGIVLARHLGVAGFETYVVASAAFILMVMLVPQGLEKYALKLLPPLREQGQAAQLHGYLRFASLRILLACVVVGLAVGAWAWHAPGLALETRVAILLSCASLPAGALVHLALEVLTIFGRAFVATVVFRLLVPGLVLALVCMLLALHADLRATWAIGAWGTAWCVALGVMAWQLHRALPAGLLRTAPAQEPRRWAQAARPFWIYRVSLAVLAQAGIVALEWHHPSATAVGAFAAALATASIAQVLATATNRVYASRLSLLLDQGDFGGISPLRRSRLRWLVLPLLAYLLLTFVFARELIGLFRPEFVAEGATALRILAASTALSTVLAMAPTYLKHRGENRVLFQGVAWAAALLLVLLAVLVPVLGVIGAAIAHALATAFMYGRIALAAHRELAQLQSRQGRPRRD